MINCVCLSYCFDLFKLNILFCCNGKIYFVLMVFIFLFEENLVNICMYCLFFGNKINLNK